MADYKGVLICGEIREGKLLTITKELITVGRKLSHDLNQPLNLLLIGQNIEEAANEAISLGIDVYIVDDVPFAESNPERYVATITNICQQASPSIILFGQTDIGRDIAPRLGARLGGTVCMDCVELAIDRHTQSLLQTKPVYGGNAMAVWASIDHQPQVVTMRPRVAVPAESDTSVGKGKIVPVTVEVDDSMIKSKLLETVKESVKGIRLEEAKVIVAGGGGIGGSQGFKLIQELAQILRGTIGISRVPCDEGWMPTSLEIGQTGHIVSPDLYIAVGISGAPQHLAGCSTSKCIVAINKDSTAHIFLEADFGIVGDYREVLPPLIEKCKALLAT